MQWTVRIAIDVLREILWNLSRLPIRRLSRFGLILRAVLLMSKVAQLSLTESFIAPSMWRKVSKRIPTVANSCESYMVVPRLASSFALCLCPGTHLIRVLSVQRVHSDFATLIYTFEVKLLNIECTDGRLAVREYEIYKISMSLQYKLRYPNIAWKDISTSTLCFTAKVGKKI